MARSGLTILAYFLLHFVSLCMCGFCTETSMCHDRCTTTETYTTKCGYMNLDNCTATRIIRVPCMVICNITVCCYGYTGEDCSVPTCFNSTTCDNGGTCTGVDHCSCPSGFRSPKCSDIDECIENLSGCDHDCTNHVGSYTCSCRAGYVMTADQHTCKDIDECSDGTALCEQLCHNHPGHYNCSCREGYTLYTDQPNCNGKNPSTCMENQTLVDLPNRCARTELFQSVTELETCLEGAECSETRVVSVLGKVSDKTTTTQEGHTEDQLTQGDILLVIAGLNALVNFTADGRNMYNNTLIIAEFMNVANNLLDVNNTVSWRNLLEKERYGAENVVVTVSNYIETILTKNKSESISVSNNNIMIDVRPISNCSDRLSFPADAVGTNIQHATRVFLKCQHDIGEAYSGAIYRNITQMIEDVQFDDKHTDVQRDEREEAYYFDTEKKGENSTAASEYVMGSSLIMFKLGSHKRNLDPPIQLTFQLFKAVDPAGIRCVFLDISNGSKRWSTNGCRVTKVENDFVHCECYHLTNFAVLINPRLLSSNHAALSTLSILGCSISMFGSLITFIVHAAFWRLLKSTRTTLLMHLCAVIFTAYLLFITSQHYTTSKVLCTTMAIVQHYLFLLMFFLMLAEGLYLANKVLIPHSVDSITKILVATWVIPAVIVAISVGATETKGYGNDRLCWLAVASGLIWAFYCPAVVIVAINIVIVGLVLRRMFGTSALKNRSERQRIMTGIRSVCVMVPVTGIAWLMGLFTLVDRAVVFQYLFVLFTTLQGLFILIFHCLLNQQVQAAVLRSYTRMKTASDTSADFTTKKFSTMGKRSLGASSNIEPSDCHNVSSSASFVNKIYAQY